MRPCLYLAFITLLGTCAPPPNVAPTEVVSQIRYQEARKELSARVRVSPDRPTRPTLFNDAMEPAPNLGEGHYRSRRKMAFPASIRFGIPTETTDERRELKISFSPALIDSLPRLLHRGANYKFPVGSEPLKDTESLELFFEPTERAEPKRIQLRGPTAGATFNLPSPAMSDLKNGEYTVYLIKQQLHRDSLPAFTSSVQTEYFTRSVRVQVVD